MILEYTEARIERGRSHLWWRSDPNCRIRQNNFWWDLIQVKLPLQGSMQFTLITYLNSNQISSLSHLISQIPVILCQGPSLLTVCISAFYYFPLIWFFFFLNTFFYLCFKVVFRARCISKREKEKRNTYLLSLIFLTFLSLSLVLICSISHLSFCKIWQ